MFNTSHTFAPESGHGPAAFLLGEADPVHRMKKCFGTPDFHEPVVPQEFFHKTNWWEILYTYLMIFLI
jgi:hypothetical protein